VRERRSEREKNGAERSNATAPRGKTQQSGSRHEQQAVERHLQLYPPMPRSPPVAAVLRTPRYRRPRLDLDARNGKRPPPARRKYHRKKYDRNGDEVTMPTTQDGSSSARSHRPEGGVGRQE